MNFRVLRLPTIKFSLLNVIQGLTHPHPGVCPGAGASGGMNCCDWKLNAVKGSFGGLETSSGSCPHVKVFHIFPCMHIFKVND